MKFKAKLRVCASCEWIFEYDPQGGLYGDGDCPKCGFAHYGARYVYGDTAYKYKYTQRPWLDKKVKTYTSKLYDEIVKTNPIKKKTKTIELGFKI